MKKRLTILAAALSLSFLGTANATLFGGDTTNNVTNNNPTANAGAAASSSSNSTAVSGSVSGASASNKSTLNNRSNVSSNNQSGASVSVEATDGNDYAPPVYAPNLTTGICMGSASGGLSVPGGGLSFGSTTTDEECQIRYNSIRLEQLGMDAAGVVIMCQIQSARLALEQTGYACPAAPSASTNDNRGSMKPVWDN